MKKFYILFFIFCLLSFPVFASEIPGFAYKDLPNKSKISYDSTVDKWTLVPKKEQTDCFIKTKLNDNETVYLNNEGICTFNTNCEYEFIKNGMFIGYSNKDLKFYNFVYINNELQKRELTKDEVQEILPNYKIINFSDFSPNTNALKIKKEHGSINILLLNNTNRTFDDYSFTSGNARIKTYKLNGFLTVEKKGMIQFSGSKETPWYMLLVR